MNDLILSPKMLVTFSSQSVSADFVLSFLP